jgi:hypothetical protein
MPFTTEEMTQEVPAEVQLRLAWPDAVAVAV